MTRTLVLLFFVHLATRLIFILFIGFYNNYNLETDSYLYVGFGDEALKGNFNFELDIFIISPLFPIVVGLFKLLFFTHWETFLILFQLVLSALSGVYLYKLSILVFNKKNVALLGSLVFAIFPMTLWFTNTFSQECLFQSLFIFFMYYFFKSIVTKNIYDVIFSAILFSLAYQTKSHILLFSLFIPVIYIQLTESRKKAITYSLVFATISLLFSLPYGLYHLKKNETYVISSNGGAYQFYLGNTNAGYVATVDVPSEESEDYTRLKDINVTAGYFNGCQSCYDKILSLPQKEKQTLFYQEAIRWIMSNPKKIIELKLYDLALFVTPGVSWRHYSFWEWLLSFMLSLPLYLFGYYVLLKHVLKKQIYTITPFIYLFITMLLFSLIWYAQNRFRTITLEPFYILISALPMCHLISRFSFTHHIMKKTDEFFHK